MSRLLIVVGLALVVAGIAWPYLSRLGLGRLPGDITIEGEKVSFYFPITSSIIVSVALSIIAFLIMRR